MCFQVKVVEQGMGYLIFGSLVTACLALLPYCFRLAQKLDVVSLSSASLEQLLALAIGSRSVLSYAFFIITTVERAVLSGLFFFMLCVAERTYKQVRLILLWCLGVVQTSMFVFVYGELSAIYTKWRLTQHFQKCAFFHSAFCLRNSSAILRRHVKLKNPRFLTFDWRKYKTLRCGFHFDHSWRYGCIFRARPCSFNTALLV